MTGRIEMIQVKQLLRMRHKEGKSDYKVGKMLGISKNTVKSYYVSFLESCIDYEEVSKLNNDDLYDLFGSKDRQKNKRREDLEREIPNFKLELQKRHVDKTVLFLEYKAKYPDGYNYTQFCHYMKQGEKASEASLLLDHKSGEKMFVDFTGSKLYVTEKGTGKRSETEVFVAILPCSQMTYVEAVRSQKLEDFLNVTVNSLKYFGGSPEAIIPDNLRSAVTKADRYEPEKNRNYKILGEHYNTTIFPTRPNHPKDKAYVEGVVKIIYKRIFAPLRNRIFYSIEELNQAVFDLLEKHNDTLLSGRKETRRELFESVEKPLLKPLPANDYIMKKFETKKVNKFYEIQLGEDKFYYSVPYQYIGETVEIIYSKSEVEVFFKHKRIAWHKREYKKVRTINPEHLPAAHKAYVSWNKESILALADQIGESTSEYCKQIIESKNYPFEGHRACLGILSLGKESSYGKERLNNACLRGLLFKSFSLKTIKSILKKNLDKKGKPEQNYELPTHENVRRDYC